MSADDSDGKPSRAGNGQFAKGISGNRRGRPRKAERAYSPSQIRHDIFDLMETEVPTKILGKSEHLSAIKVIYWRMIMKAVEGDHKMILAVVNLRRDLMQEHKIEHWDAVSALENFEKMLLSNGGNIDPDTRNLLNQLRKRTRGNFG